MLSPDTKGLNFLPDSEKLSAHQLLLNKALSLVGLNENLLANIIKEKLQVSFHIRFSSPTILPVLDDVECPPPKKLKKVNDSKCTDLEEWFDDVTFVSEDLCTD